MIRLGLRLTLGGGREAITRLIVTAVAVGIGTCLLLLTLAAVNAVSTQNGRYAWLNAGYAPGSPHTAGVDPLWWKITGDLFDGRTIGRVDIAETGPHSPRPPGISTLPGPGQYVASPALSALLARTPAAELGDRYPGARIGTIGRAGLPTPDALIIVIGHPVSTLATAPHASRVTTFDAASPGDCGCYSVGVNAKGIDLILAVVAAALLFPVLIFLGSATRVTAASREQRFAAMRLVGATTRQIATVSGVESGVAAVIGTVVGFALFFPFRAPVASIPFTGAAFFPSDLSLSVIDVLAVALTIPVGAVAATQLALRRVQVSPLGVTRRVTPDPPRAHRVVPLLAGLAELGYFVVVGRPSTTAGQLMAYVSGILVIMAGLVIAGPWLTMIGARLILRRTNRPSVLLAGRRMADNPKTAFRAISGLILGLFVATVTVGIITTIVHFQEHPADGVDGNSLLLEDFSGLDPHAPRPASPTALINRLQAIRGVEAVAIIHVPPGPADPEQQPGLISCDDLDRLKILGRCPPGSSTVTMEADLYPPSRSQRHTTWPAAHETLAQTSALPVQTILVSTDGTTAVLERARTLFQLTYPFKAFPASTPDEYKIQNAKELAEYRQLANAVILASLPIAGCSLAVSVGTGLAERKRPFSLLRLAGVPVSVLRRVIAYETVVPLLASAVLAVGTGLAAAELFLQSQLNYTLQAPTAAYYLIVVVGLAVSLAIVATTLPMLSRMTGPEIARND